MSAWLTLTGKVLRESRWLLGLSVAALFALSWLSVYVTGRVEKRMREASDPVQAMRRAAFLRGMGGSSMDFSSAAIEVAIWNHPFFTLVVGLWGISRATMPIAGEIERGQLDLTLSRPITRTSYLSSHVFVTAFGFCLLAVGLIVGNLVGTHYNRIDAPPSVFVLCRPAVNLMMLGLAMFGYTFFFSAVDVVRWRPNLFGSVLTLAMFILVMVVGMPTLEDYKWLEHYSIFKAYNPVEAVLKGEDLGQHLAALGAVFGVGTVLTWLLFLRRDLPANG